MAADKHRAIEKVRALFARAGREDTPIEEARTSALLGARLFVKHELGLSEQSEVDFDRDEVVADQEEETRPSGRVSDRYNWREPPQAGGSSTRSRTRYDRHGPIPDVRERERASPPPARKRARESVAKQTPSPAPPKPSKPRSPRAAAAQAAVQETLRAWAVNSEGQSAAARRWSRTPGHFLLITSDFVGRCVSCREGYVPGERLAWRPHYGATHYGCRAFWDTSCFSDEAEAGEEGEADPFT